MRTSTYYLPWPPSTNSAVRCYQGRAILSKPYRDWRKAADAMLAENGGRRGIEGRVHLSVEARPGSRRRYDLDNRLKAVQDALTRCGVWNDDEQVDSLEAVKGRLATSEEQRKYCANGYVVAMVTELA